jgi:hypothetical protein
MPVAEFVRKSRATKGAPKMIKAILLNKAFVAGHLRHMRSGKVVVIAAHRDGRSKRPEGHPDLFSAPATTSAPTKTKKFYVTMVRDKRVAWLAGPFDKHEDALAHVEPARKAANEVDPWSEFDAFGTAHREAEQHPPGVLNRKLGIGAQMAKALLFVQS